jgi:hypothetical protein
MTLEMSGQARTSGSSVWTHWPKDAGPRPAKLTDQDVANHPLVQAYNQCRQNSLHYYGEARKLYIGAQDALDRDDRPAAQYLFDQGLRMTQAGN